MLFVIPAIVALIAGPTRVGTCTDLEGFERACNVPTGGSILLFVGLLVVGIIGYLVIYIRMLGRGATWGRKATGYRVLDERTMQPIGTGRAIGRYFAVILSAMPCYLGYLWPLWDSENRTFHDMIVRTRAVRN